MIFLSIFIPDKYRQAHTQSQRERGDRWINYNSISMQFNESIHMGCSTGTDLSVTTYFSRVCCRVGCSFLVCRGGSAKYQKCFIFHWPSRTLDCGSAHLETFLLWISMACWLHFSSCPILLPSCLEKLAIQSFFSTRTPPPDSPWTLTDRTWKGHQPVVNITHLTWTLPIKIESIPVFSHRVGNISEGQAGNTYRQAVNTKPTRQLHNRQAGNCVGQAGFIFTTQRLSTDAISVYISQVSIYSASFGIWHLMDYIWQHFKNRSFSFYNYLG